MFHCLSVHSPVSLKAIRAWQYNVELYGGCWMVICIVFEWYKSLSMWHTAPTPPPPTHTHTHFSWRGWGNLRKIVARKAGAPTEIWARQLKIGQECFVLDLSWYADVHSVVFYRLSWNRISLVFILQGEGKKRGKICFANVMKAYAGLDV
jgi:hypothetical protein